MVAGAGSLACADSHFSPPDVVRLLTAWGRERERASERAREGWMDGARRREKNLSSGGMRLYSRLGDEVSGSGADARDNKC